MNFEFLDKFERRMKNIGMYAVLFKNSSQKGTWKNYGFDCIDEQINLIFTVLLYIMEQSLKEEVCTMDDIASFVDAVNMKFYHKSLSFSDCKELSEFIIHVILSDEGKPMYFQGYNYQKHEYEKLHVSFIQNRIAYIEQDIRRTSYSLTNDGYSMLLSTLELEENMKLTIHEMIFKLHLERATYDKALEEVKAIFHQLRIRLQNMKDAMMKIKRNVLEYSVKEYREILIGNMNSLDQTNAKYESYRQTVLQRVLELEEKDINIHKLDPIDLESLQYLKTIDGYLNQSIDVLQKLMITHFDLKNLYSTELETISQMSMVKRFSFRNEIYDRVLDDVSMLEHMDEFLRPLLNSPLSKTYNMNKAFQLHKLSAKDEESKEEIVDFDDEQWEIERREQINAKLRKYTNSMKQILRLANQSGGITLHELRNQCEHDASLKQQLIPTIEIFREIMIELMKNKTIDVSELRKEQAKNIVEQPSQFQLNFTILELIDTEETLKDINKITTTRMMEKEAVCFEHIKAQDGTWKRILCQDLWFQIQ